jgi:general secretion pathway protein G
MKLRTLTRPFQAAFTLMEIMLVVLIIALLAGLAINNLGDVFGIGQDTAAKSNMTTYKTLLTTYRGLTGNYPSTEQGLKALAARPSGDPQPLNWRKLTEGVNKDPWGRDFVYRYPGQKNPDSFDIYSMGKDGQPGTADDVWP